MQLIHTPVRTYTRAAGILLFLTIICGAFGELYVPSQIMTGDAAATIANLQAREGFFRIGFAAYLVEAFCDVALSLIFYVLLRSVHRDLALFSAFLGLLRQSFPRSRDFSTITAQELQVVEDQLNDRPRKRLGYLTPSEIFFNQDHVALQS